jgi:CRISPR-associated Csx2 family protein
MTKILISFVGTGSLDKNNQSVRAYRKAQYEIQGKTHETSFVAEALAKHLEIEKIFLIGTAKSMWEEVYLKFSSNTNEKFWENLAHFVENANKDTNINASEVLDLKENLEKSLPSGSKIFFIRYGLNDTELWENFRVFNQVFQDLPDNAEIFLDITHSFRSLPVFAMVSMFYLQDVIGKKIKLQGIFYGMLDVMRETNNKAQVINLKPLVEMLQWVKAAQPFRKYGMSYELLSLLENENIKEIMKDFSDFLQLNYINEVATQVSQINNIRGRLSELSEPAQITLEPILNDFSKAFQNQQNISQKQLTLAKWHNKNMNYGFAYINLIEAMISYVCECEKLTPVEKKENREKAKDLLHKEAKYRPLFDIYQNANSIRNKIAHAIPNGKADKQKDIENLRKYIDEIGKIIGTNSQ